MKGGGYSEGQKAKTPSRLRRPGLFFGPFRRFETKGSTLSPRVPRASSQTKSNDEKALSQTLHERLSPRKARAMRSGVGAGRSAAACGQIRLIREKGPPTRGAGHFENDHQPCSTVWRLEPDVTLRDDDSQRRSSLGGTSDRERWFMRPSELVSECPLSTSFGDANPLTQSGAGIARTTASRRARARGAIHLDDMTRQLVS